MGILGERYCATYEGHTIELVRTNLTKQLELVIDGKQVAREGRALPHDITLEGTLEHGGVTHKIVARSIVKGLSTNDSIELDGKPLAIAKK